MSAVTSQVTREAPGRRRADLAVLLRKRGIGRVVARTASYNVASMVAAGLGGVIVARALGPELRGEYTAVTAWTVVLTMVGQLGQPAAACFFVAHQPERARDYVATSRALTLAAGTIVLTASMLLAPLLAHGNGELTTAYRIGFATMAATIPAASYVSALQARDLRRWNTAWVLQPALNLAALIAAWRLRMLTLDSALIIIAASSLAQLGWAYSRCRTSGLAPGRSRVSLVRPLAGYGAAQIAALTPAALNVYLDQLVLSLVVPAAVLGRYAIAVTCTLLPMPMVTAIGNVAFPRLAAREYLDGQARRMQWLGILGAGVAAAAALVPLDLVAPWLIPHVFGPRYADVTPLVWALTPAGVLLACSQVTGDILRGRKRPLVVARAQGMAAVFTVVLLLTLLPVVGVYGAAIASVVAYGVALAVMLLSLHGLPSRPGTPRHGKQPDRTAASQGEL
jgi:O-antigen/teichoic acid export membrane protein